MTGRYEPARFAALAALLRRDDVFWDVGAHYGYATLIAAGILDDPHDLVSIEPSTPNRSYLMRHLRWNNVSGSHVMACAIAEHDGTDSFGGSGGSVSFHLGHPGERVEVRSLDSLVATGLPAPTFVKIDVEGAEALVLAGARSLLSGANGPRSAPMVLVSVHDPTLQRSSLRALKDMGYTVLGSLGIAAFENGTRPWEGDPDLLGIPPHRGADLDAFRAIPWFAGGAEW